MMPATGGVELLYYLLEFCCIATELRNFDAHLHCVYCCDVVVAGLNYVFDNLLELRRVLGFFNKQLKLVVIEETLCGVVG